MRLPPLHSLPDWSEFPRVALDIETCDPDLTKTGPGVRRGKGFITGVSFACDDGTPQGPAFYLPIRHEGGGNYDNPEQVLEYLRFQAREFRGDIVGANLQYDLDWLAESGVMFRPRFFRDVQISGPLLDVPNANGIPNSMSLNALAKREGLAGKDERRLYEWAKDRKLDPKKDMWRMPARMVSEYAIQDVWLPLQILKRHEREIDAQELWTVYNMECELLPVLLKMRRRGVAVDLNKLGQIEEMAAAREGKAMREATRLSGVTLTAEDTNKSAALARALKADGIKVPETPRRISEKTGREVGGQPSVKADHLKMWAAGGSKVAVAISEAKRWNKIRTTFCESIRNHEVRGRVHCTFNQLRQERETGETKGAEFGRLSSSDPNLQQQPARDPEIGPLWRSIYVPDDGGQWACLDFSSQEPRLITHYAEMTGAAGGAAAAEACRSDPEWDNHGMMAGMMYDEYDHDAYLAGDKAMKTLRDNAKTIFLGLCYGMGGGKLCRSLGLDTEWATPDWAGGRKVEVAGPEGQALLDRFMNRVPYVKQLQKMAQKKAQRVGYIKTLLGRRCRFPRLPDGRIDWAHKALNRLIQGSAADQTKLAMVLADKAGIRLQLQVHDELDLTIWDRKEAEQLNEMMVSAVELTVPTRCDIEIGPTWGEIR